MSGTVQGATQKAATERYEAFLRVSQNLISIRSSEELFRLLAGELRAVGNFYDMGVDIQLRYEQTRESSVMSRSPQDKRIGAPLGGQR